jgi:hypothetical protein
MSNDLNPPGSLPPTRVISWLQRCEEVDPNYTYARSHYYIYEMSNRRRFLNPLPLYTST